MNLSSLEHTKLSKRRLVGLLHAYECMRTIDIKNCKFPHCERIRKLWDHMRLCSVYDGCSTNHCDFARKLLKHWINCLSMECPICSSIRLKDEIRLKACDLYPLIPKSVEDISKKELTPKFRKEYLEYYLNLVCSNYAQTMTDRRFKKIKKLIESFEVSAYDNSVNVHDYQQILALKVAQIQQTWNIFQRDNFLIFSVFICYFINLWIKFFFWWY